MESLNTKRGSDPEGVFRLPNGSALSSEFHSLLSAYWQARRREARLLLIGSHEARGVLAGVIAGLDDLLDDAEPLPDQLRERLSRLSSRAWNLSQLLGDMVKPRENRDACEIVESAQVYAGLSPSLLVRLENAGIVLRLPQESHALFGELLRLREVMDSLLRHTLAEICHCGGAIEASCRKWDDEVHLGVHVEAASVAAARGSVSLPKGPGLQFAVSTIESFGGRFWTGRDPAGRESFWFSVPTGSPPAVDVMDAEACL